MNVEVIYTGSYTKPEKRVQTLQYYMLYLALSGFDYMHLHDGVPENRIFPEDAASKVPFLALFPPGITLDFSVNEKRENWAILFEEKSSDLSKKFPCTYCQLPLTGFLPLKKQKVFSLRQLFSDAVENFSSGSPVGIAKVKLQTIGILAELLPVQESRTVRNSVAEALKNAIDGDEHFRYSLGELCRMTGSCSVLYMRKCFHAEYGMLPGEYRDQKRLNRILELFAQSDDSLKMIADEVGMKHLPHLYAFLKRHRNLTPKQLMLQFRGIG